MRLLRFARNDEFYGILKFSSTEILGSKLGDDIVGNSKIPSLRGSNAEGAIPFKIPSKIPVITEFRHCEGATQREQSHSRLNKKA